MSKPKAYIGIDPGASGAICLLVPDVPSIVFVSTTSEPAQLMQSFMSLQGTYALAPVMMEDVHSLPKMSAKSNFTFGRNVERLQTVVKCAGLGLDLVQPKIWQKTVGVRIPTKTAPADKKKIVAEVATRLYPAAEIYGPKGGLLDGRSDALMIAHYCRLMYN